MYNEASNCVPVCDCVKEPPRAPLSELLAKLNDLSTENLDLATIIKDNLYGAEPNKSCDPKLSIGCMEDCIKATLEMAGATNRILIQIRERL